MNNFLFKGENLQELLYFIEEQEDKNQLPPEIAYNTEYIESSETLSVSLATIAITGVVSIVSSLVIEFFKKKITEKSSNEITYTRKGKNGAEIKITLKNLTFDNVEKEVQRFLDL